MNALSYREILKEIVLQYLKNDSKIVKYKNLSKRRCFEIFTNIDIQDPLFKRLWTLSMDSVFMQMNPGSDTPILK